MKLTHDGATVRIADGGRRLERDEPGVILIHGSGMNRTAWQLQTRYLAHHGYRAAAVDLPGHGGSDGPPIETIEEMGDWVAGIVDTLGFGTAHVVGHSMGTFVALEAAGRHPEKVRSIVLLGTAAAMPVHPELLSSAYDDVPHASRLMTSWGHSSRAHVGRHASPGLWLLGGATALLDTSPDGVLGTDMAACQAYTGALDRAAEVRCPVRVILGSDDKMTPVRAAADLEAAFVEPPAITVLDGVGHMMLAEDPDRVREAIVEALAAAS
jgi:pimeloyl-ACP methyl ester carboxylesterase